MAPRVAGRRRAVNRRTPFLMAASIGAIALAAPLSANAQSKTFYLDRLYLAGAPEDAIGLWRPEIADAPRFFGQAGLGFSFDPLRADDVIANERDAAVLRDRAGAPVSSELVGYVDAGFEFLRRFAFVAELPVIAYQTGNAATAPGIDAPSRVDLRSPALMDLRLEGRAVVFENESRSFKLGVNAAVWVPTGNEYAFGGDVGASGALGLAAEVNLKRIFFVLDTGPQFRPRSAVDDLVVASEWRAGFGAFVPLRSDTIRLGAEIFGSTGITSDTAFRRMNTPLEWMAEGRFWTDARRNGYVGVGAGTRMTSGYAPDFRGVFVMGYSFSLHDTEARAPSGRFHAWAEHGADTDHDSYPDDIDLCPNEPEDHKPPYPDDGCPALPDRDEDGVADAVDACPDTPGVANPDPRKNGCPRYVVDATVEIDLLQQVEFETGKSRILPRSFPILDEVVRILRHAVDIEHVSIEGHTDDRGPDDLNERLSNDRAASVLRYLVEHGIDPERLASRGFGPKKPIADNATAEGRQRNRRVEFKVTSRKTTTAPSGP